MKDTLVFVVHPGPNGWEVDGAHSPDTDLGPTLAILKRFGARPPILKLTITLDDFRGGAWPTIEELTWQYETTRPAPPLNPMNPDQAGDWYANMTLGPDSLHEACERRGGVCDCDGRPCYLDAKQERARMDRQFTQGQQQSTPVPDAIGACVLNGCQNAEWSRVAHEAIASRDLLRKQKRADDEREIAYVQTIGRLRDAADAALDWMENVTQWVGPGVPEDRDDVVAQLGAALGEGGPERPITGIR